MPETELTYDEFIILREQNPIVQAYFEEQQRIFAEQQQNDLLWFNNWLLNQGEGA
jgi:hypothetical protein